MAPSQLKRLKLSLKEQGVVGPQKSKKQKRQATKQGSLKEGRVQRAAALEGIRDQFNPFEVTGPSRNKYEFASSKMPNGKGGKGAISRPGVTKGLGEENRRRTLLAEMQRRKKIGGIVDRRFGENDPTLTPEERALERFVKEKQKGNKRSSLFDLEDYEESSDLTHAGKALSFDITGETDDFGEGPVDELEDDETEDFLHERPSKRQKVSNECSEGEDQLHQSGSIHPERPKSKKEVMEEIIAKSKLYKYERQQLKEDDDDLRAELDKGLPDIFALMHKSQPPPLATTKPVLNNGGMNPDRLALLNGKDRLEADKEYDERLRKIAMDQRAKPTVRTLNDEEKLLQESQRLKDLESQRLRRMRGEPDDSESDAAPNPTETHGDSGEEPDEHHSHGLGVGIPSPRLKSELDVEDEDDFIIEDDLMANASDLDVSDLSSEEQVDGASDGEDEEFVQHLLSEQNIGREGESSFKTRMGDSNSNGDDGALAYTYICPETHKELLSVTQNVPVESLPTVVQRIRALYHPKLASENKGKLGNFAAVLVDHISYLANLEAHPPFATLEALIRHIHSLAKVFPEHVGRAFRLHLKALQEERPTDPNPGDLVILTAIGSIFPTSDHFHQVVTPAMLCMTRYLSQKLPDSLSDLAIGTYVTTLCLQYQHLSKRYVPEAVNYLLNALWALAPKRPKQTTAAFPQHALPDMLRLRSISDADNTDARLDLWDILPSVKNSADNQMLKIALMRTHLALIENMTTIWAEHSAFCEVLDPVYKLLCFLESEACISTIDSTTKERLSRTSMVVYDQLRKSSALRKPLRLHNHRPLAIKTSIPKFEESFNPDKHYDPDRDRAESLKLKAEHKRERKGALRELRKDANFIARESLREKKEKDSAYEKKYKRLVADIQGEEGREAKSYEREKRMRKGRR